MKIAVVGTGYVGLPMGAVFADLGNEVTCVDIDAAKISKLKKGEPTIWEPGLEEIIGRTLKAGRLHFTTKLTDIIEDAEIFFIAVGTPSGSDGSADLQYVEGVAKDIGKALNDLPEHKRSYKVIVNKSTVPVGTGDLVRGIISEYYNGSFDVVSNPEFLRQGQAVHDNLYPDRVVVGIDGNNSKSREIMEDVYRPLKCPIVFTDVKSAELIKYAANSFLALSISFINSVANVSEKVGADVEKISEAMKLDKRIGRYAFLSAGVGYGGSCFPKDVKALIKTSDDLGYSFDILKAAEDVNLHQKKSVYKKLKAELGSLKGKKVAVWGLAFKANTDDMRESVALVAVPEIVKAGGDVVAYDPVATENAKKELKGISYASDPFKALEGADALVVLADWDEFKHVDLKRVKELMRGDVVIDGRNVFDPSDMKEIGINYVSVGR